MLEWQEPVPVTENRTGHRLFDKHRTQSRRHRRQSLIRALQQITLNSGRAM